MIRWRSPDIFPQYPARGPFSYLPIPCDLRSVRSRVFQQPIVSRPDEWILVHHRLFVTVPLSVDEALIGLDRMCRIGSRRTLTILEPEDVDPTKARFHRDLDFPRYPRVPPTGM